MEERGEEEINRGGGVKFREIARQREKKRQIDL